jgi:hypothetical protein
MHELNQRDYWRVRGLFQDLRYNLLIDSVIVGNTPARVYADDVAAPRTGWMWNRTGAMLLVGEPENVSSIRVAEKVGFFEPHPLPGLLLCAVKPPGHRSKRRSRCSPQSCGRVEHLGTRDRL